MRRCLLALVMSAALISPALAHASEAPLVEVGPYGLGGPERQMTVAPRTGTSSPTCIFARPGGWAEDLQQTSTVKSLQHDGCVVIDPSYPTARGEGEHVFPLEVDAIEEATEWGIAHAAEYGGDPSNVIMVGESAGGQLGLMASERLNVTSPGTVDALISDSGPTNLWQLVEIARRGELFNGLAIHTARALDCLKSKVANCTATNEALANEYSPVLHPVCIPTLLGSDRVDRVPLSQAEELTTVLEANGCSVELHIVEKEGHIPTLGLIGAPAFIAAH